MSYCFKTINFVIENLFNKILEAVHRGLIGKDVSFFAGFYLLEDVGNYRYRINAAKLGFAVVDLIIPDDGCK
jgi:hypothetical protein